MKVLGRLKLNIWKGQDHQLAMKLGTVLRRTSLIELMAHFAAVMKTELCSVVVAIVQKAVQHLLCSTGRTVCVCIYF